MRKSEEKNSKQSYLYYVFSDLKVRDLILLQNTFFLKNYFESQIPSSLFNFFQKVDTFHLFKIPSTL